MLTALDIAARELGFVHGDMRIANIMEHRPRDDAQACVIRSNSIYSQSQSQSQSKNMTLHGLKPVNLLDKPGKQMPCKQAGDQEFLPRGFKREIGKLQSADEFKLPGAPSRGIHAIAKCRLFQNKRQSDGGRFNFVLQPSFSCTSFFFNFVQLSSRSDVS